MSTGNACVTSPHALGHKIYENAGKSFGENQLHANLSLIIYPDNS